jgi:peroxiredoxin
LQKRAAEVAARGGSIAAISVDSVEKNAALAKKLGLSYAVLSDPRLTAIRAFGIEDTQNEIAWPSVFVVGSDGRVAARFLTQSYKSRPTAEDVVAALPPR